MQWLNLFLEHGRGRVHGEDELHFLEVRLTHPRAAAMPMSCDVHSKVMCEAVTIYTMRARSSCGSFESRARQHRLRAAAFVLCDEIGIFLVGIAMDPHEDQGFTPLAVHDGQPLDELVHLLSHGRWRSRHALFGGSPGRSGGHDVAARVIQQRQRLQHRPSGVLKRIHAQIGFPEPHRGRVPVTGPAGEILQQFSVKALGHDTPQPVRRGKLASRLRFGGR
ncbi:hypothetical protein J2W32_005510 [Variovorax boronicumulans]|uniref:Uncharacterized protein n=1 Tax=Variovorax boronicumulans TaxID=436515 RepID=A0AAW8D6S9_9BURK|nr:hypothetical protein [Variovorax boronicumulans]MDP9896249.1 hypothetical protein [Variovorax boronicumulans]MDQ0056442.1 hypothetical protein [Variovorax boronicumulans]